MTAFDPLGQALTPVPPELVDRLPNVRGCLIEWRDYPITWPGAEFLRVGDQVFTPLARDVFVVRLENRIGLTRVQAFARGRPIGEAVGVEVLSSKFPTPEAHVRFFRTLLEDLYRHATSLPFSLGGPTGRGVEPVSRPPSPLFVLHFLCEAERALDAALAAVLAAPHRALVTRDEHVPLADVHDADADVLLGILLTPEDWQRAEGLPLADLLDGHAPTRVRQRRAVETYDTPENRFVLRFLRRLSAEIDSLPKKTLWPFVPAERRDNVRRVGAMVRRAVRHPVFEAVGTARSSTSRSQVLLRRDGYRELRELAERFEQARRPFFAKAESAIAVRDIATMYEAWCFLELSRAIGTAVGVRPDIHLPPFDEADPGRHGETRFGDAGVLVYNRAVARSYSVPVRPDFTWQREERPTVVLDAKFRLQRATFDDPDEDSRPGTIAKRADLYKMHAYRDALRVRAAVAVYPGDTAVFHDCARGRQADVDLLALLAGEHEGIGALPLQPGRPTTREEAN